MSEETKLFGGIILIIGIACGVLLLLNHESPEQQQSLYRSWSLATGNTNLNFSQWSELRNAKLLPGQNHSDTTIMPMPVIIPMR